MTRHTLQPVFLTFAAMGLATMLVTGCAVDQKQEVDSYRKVLDARAAPVRAPAPGGPLSLRAAMQLANRNNETLGLEGEQYVQALIAKTRAVAGFLPTVALAPSYSINSSPLLGAVRTDSSDSHTNVPIVGSINLFRGFGDTATLKAAEATIAQRRNLLLDLQATVLLNVGQVYYQVLRSERQVKVLTNSLAVQKARLTDIRQRFEHGLATSLDVAQSTAEVAATRVTLTQARNDVANGRALLARLLGLPAVDGPLTDEFPVPESLPGERELEQTAMRRRQDLLAAKQEKVAARHSVDAAFAQYYPSVSLNTAAFMYPENLSSAERWNAILVVNVPIFTAGVIRADVRAAWSHLREAGLHELGTGRQVRQDVQTAFNNLISSEKVVRGLRAQVAASTEAYRLAHDAYLNGLAINLDVLTAQDQLLGAQLQLAAAEFDRTVFYLDLLRATGALDLGTVPAGLRPARR